MAESYYGATQAEWEAFASLNLRDLLPTVCDPTVKRHPRSNSAAQLDKVPSMIDADGYGYGLLNWPQRITTSVHDWVIHPALGICMIARSIHAIDIDIENPQAADRAEATIREYLGIDGMRLPVRTRKGSGKRLLMFRLSDGPEHVKKQLVKCPQQGLIEFLFHKQQFRVAGRHRDGNRLEWPDGIPATMADVPAIKMTELQGLLRMLALEFGGEATNLQLDGTTGATPTQRRRSQVSSDDPVVNYLLTQTDLVRNERPDGALDVHCPWAWEHAHPTPDNVTEATFFPVGLGEIKTQPGFKCMHATCAHRNWQMFLAEIGYEDTFFDVVEAPTQEVKAANARPVFTYKGRSNVIESTLPNIAAALRWPEGFGYVIRYDSFKDAIVFRAAKDTEWRILDDDTYTLFRLRLARIGMEGSVAKENVRDAVSLIARENSVDTAQEWLRSLVWDGTPRIGNFHVRALRQADTPYHQAVCLYMWTALAGRIMDPGCKADMVPVFISGQGMRKSSMTEIIAPSFNEYTVVSLANRDADLARQLRGKMVAEWSEMRGMNTRDAEAVKGWISQRADEWIPKFKEHATLNPRRFLLIGNANEKYILNDPTGARRFLPSRLDQSIDTDYIECFRDQLWAEARSIWERTGIQWQLAEQLAPAAHRSSTVKELWEPSVVQWLQEQGGRDGWTSLQLLTGACQLSVSQANAGAYQRLRRVMAAIGWEEGDDGRWYCNLV